MDKDKLEHLNRLDKSINKGSELLSMEDYTISIVGDNKVFINEEDVIHKNIIRALKQAIDKELYKLKTEFKNL